MLTGDAHTAAAALFELEPAAVRCPYPIFASLRQAAPVAWFDELDAFVVSRYDLITEVLRQADKFSSRCTTGPATDRAVGKLLRELVAEDSDFGALVERSFRPGTPPVLVRADPPEHTRQRALVNRAFSPATIRTLEPEIHSLANALIDEFIDRGEVELMREFAVPLPMTVIATALGVSLDRMDDFKRWSDGIVGGIGNSGLDKEGVAQIVRARFEVGEYLLGVIEEREREPRDDLVSQIVHARVDGEHLSRFEIIEMVIQFLIAGNETTAKLITSSVFRLARDPQLAERLRADPSLVQPFAEEVLRLEPPATGLYRIAETDYELGGVPIPAGSNLWLIYAAGNRDAAQFEEPDACVLDRSTSTPHLGFGLGAHFCLGAGLARAESRIGIQALLARCDDLRLAIDEADVPYDPSYMVHGIQRLPLRFSGRMR